MQFQRDHDPAVYNIRAYAPGEITITLPRATSGPVELEAIQGSFVISPQRVLPEWAVRAVDEVTDELLAQLLEWEPELVILGTGERLQFPSPQVSQSLIARQIGLEVMDTAAACRTYNILVAEGRRVVAALINPPQPEENSPI